MTPVKTADLTPSSDGRIVVYAKNQEEYCPLPTVQFPDGKVYSEWLPSVAEAQMLMNALGEGRPVKIRLWQWTFGGKLQPVALEVVP